MTSPYLTTDEAAAYLGYETAGAVREARASGLEPVGRRGPRGPYLYRREDIDLWLKNCLTGGQAPVLSTSSSAVDEDGDVHEEDERARGLPAQDRTVSSPCDGEMPDHGEDAGKPKNTTSRRDDTGGCGAARRDKSGIGTRPDSRLRDHYRSQLRDALAGTKK